MAPLCCSTATSRSCRLALISRSRSATRARPRPPSMLYASEISATATVSAIVIANPPSTRAEMLWRMRRGWSQRYSRRMGVIAAVYSRSDPRVREPPSRTVESDHLFNFRGKLTQHVGCRTLASPDRIEPLVDHSLHLGDAG